MTMNPQQQPIMNYQPPMQGSLVSNQVEPFQITGERPYCSRSTFTICPNCHAPIYTNVTKNFNVLNCLTYVCCGPCWLCYKCWNVKDYNCFDAEHTCPKCNAHIGKYETC